MKNLKIEKLKYVEAPQNDEDYKAMGIIGFQLVKFTIDFFGHKDEFVLDTKILKDGQQLVIDGNGWIESGYQVA